MKDTSPPQVQEQSATFIHRFFGWLEAEARYHINPDGSRGGIVAVTAKIGTEVKIAETASVGYGASVDNRASVGDGASVGNRASVGYGDWWITVGPQGSRNTILTAVASKEHGMRWWVGCQLGISTDDFREQIKKTHGENDHAQDYLALIAFVESHPGLARWRKAQGDVK